MYNHAFVSKHYWQKTLEYQFFKNSKWHDDCMILIHLHLLQGVILSVEKEGVFVFY